MDDGDSKQNKQTKTKRTSLDVLQRYISNVSDVLSAIWVRRTIQNDNGYKWFVLDSRRGLLFNFRLFLVIVYITYEIFK